MGLNLQPMQLQVRLFSRRYVQKEYKQKFKQIMILWDGSSDVMDAYYDWDILCQKRREAME